jgi:hypothetical protein
MHYHNSSTASNRLSNGVHNVAMRECDRESPVKKEGRKNRIIQGTLEVMNGILRWMLNSNSSEAGGFRLDLLIATKKIDFLSFLMYCMILCELV